MPRSARMQEVMRRRRIRILRWLLEKEGKDPVALTEVAKRLGRAREEVRRDVERLCEDGYCAKRFTREVRACFEFTHKVKVVVVWALPAGRQWLIDIGESDVA